MPPGGGEPISPPEVIELFRRLTLGVYGIGVSDGRRQDIFTAAWVMQVSFEPLLLALSINPRNASYQLLQEGGGFTVNVLKETQLEWAREFGTSSGRDKNKLAGIRWSAGRTGAPILEEALAYFDCTLEGRHRAGDHELVLGRVVDGRLLAPGALPLAYSATGDMDGSSALYPKRL